MKIKLTIISLLILVGVSLLAASFTPIATWPFKGLNAQRTGQNKDVTDINAKNLGVEWMYPSVAEDTDYYARTIDSPSTIIGEGWINSNSPKSQLEANPNRIWTGGDEDPHFLYTIGEAANSSPSYVEFKFDGLREGDQYQVFMSVPSELTKNETGYNLATSQYVMLQYQDENGTTKNGEYAVNISREEYAGTWMYVTGELITIGPDGKLDVKLSNKCNYNVQSEEDPSSNIYSDTAIGLADAVRIVRVYKRSMVGSPVACAFPKESFILDSDNVEYDSSAWVKASNHFGFYVNDKFFMTNTKANSVPLYNNMFVLKPDCAATDKKFTYNFNVGVSGLYKIYVNKMSFLNTTYPMNGQDYKSFANYQKQYYSIYSGDTKVSSFSVDMYEPGWDLSSVVELAAGSYKLVMEPSSIEGIPTDGSSPYVYVVDGVRFEKANETITAIVTDVGANPVGVSAFNTNIRDTELGMAFSKDFLNKIGVKNYGFVAAFQIKGSTEYWKYPNYNNEKWIDIEGPVRGFASSPVLSYIPDPNDNTKTILAAFVGDVDGIVYGFDVTGSEYGVSTLHPKSKLLFKGPGIFLPEPINLAGTEEVANWSVSDSNYGSFGSKYLYTNNTYVRPIKWSITDDMREKAGDATVYNMNKNLTGFIDKSYSQWNWRVKFWVPPVEMSEGTTYTVVVTWFDEDLGEERSKSYDVKIEYADLGTWKSVNVNDTFRNIKEVSIAPKSIPTGHIAIVDNIWLYPALPAGESLGFEEGIEFVTNVDKYNSNGVTPEMNASVLFTPTSAGRILAYDIKNGIDGENRIAKIVWEYPKFQDRKTSSMASAPSYTNSRLYWTAKPYGAPNSIALYSLDTTNLVNYLNGNFSSGYYNYDEPLVNIISGVEQNNLLSGVVNYLPGKTGIGYGYSLLGNNNGENFLHKLLIGNSQDASATVLSSQNIPSVCNSTPSVCEYTTNNGNISKTKILFPDLNGTVYSYELGGDTDIASGDFTSPLTTNATNGEVVSNIVTDYYYDETTKNHIPNGYFGADDGYLTIFNTVSGEKINRLIAGMQYDNSRKRIKSSALLLPNSDAEGESIINVNGADGYNYTYNYHVYYEQKKWKNNLAIGSNWQDLLDELEVVTVDPTDIEDLADVQLEVVDYETAKALIDIHNDSTKEDSLYKKLFSTDILKRFDIPDTADVFINKNMMILDKEAWGYVMTGTKGVEGDSGSIDTQSKADRLRYYLRLEAEKCRMNHNFKGETNTAEGAGKNKSRALFYELDNDSGQKDPRKNNKGITLEWGDHIYLALWNLPAKASLKGLAPVVFEYQNEKVNIGNKTVSNSKRQVPASVTKIYNFPTYDLVYENKNYDGDKDNEKVKKILTSTGSTIQRKLTLIDITLDCTRNRIPSMVGSGYKLAVDLTLPNYTGKVIRYYVSSLNSGTLGGDLDPILLTETSDWVKIDDTCYREEFTVNNPLTLKVGNSVYGKTYKRYDDDASYNKINGVKESDVETVSIGEFSHGYLSPIKDVATAANRSEMNITNFRYSAGNHDVSDNTVKIGSQSAGESNYYSNKLPWEYGIGSADYPAIDKDNVEVLDEYGENIISYDSILKTEKPWTTGKSKSPYLEGRTGNVETGKDKKAVEIRYQIEVPRYQPAMKQYIADAIVYVDSDANGKFSKGGTYDAPSYTCEPYRRFKIAFGVTPAAELYVDEDYIYIGEPGHGLGYPLAMNGIFTPYQEGILGQQINSQNEAVSYNPYNKKPEVMKWFKPFTVYNDGNVNLFDLSLNKEPLFKVESNKNMSTLNEGIETSQNYNDNYKDRLRISEYNVISSFDTKAYSDVADTPVDLGAKYPFSSNRENFGAGLSAGRSLTITKPRVGDMDGVYMSIPDGKKTTGKAFKLNSDYNRKYTGSDYELDVRDAQNPMVSVEVPIGQPVGEYRSINPMRVSAKYVNKGGVATIISGNGIYLDLNVREAQVTGVPYDKNTAHASLYGISPQGNNLTYYSYPEFFVSYPLAFQNKDNEVSLAFSDNIIANNENLDLDELEKSQMPLNFSLLTLKAKNNVGKGINEAIDFYNRDYWWNGGSISIEDNGWPNDIEEGYNVSDWNDNSDYKMSYFMYPSYYRHGQEEYITFSGKAQLEKDGKLQADKTDNRIFYIKNGSSVATSLNQLDSSKEMKNPVMFMKGDKKWFFFESTVDGKSSISFTTEDVPNDYRDEINGYTPELKVRIPDSITSAGKPNIIDRDKDDNVIELIYTGVNKITGGTDVYMSEYSLDSTVETNLDSPVASSDIQIYALTQGAKPLSRTYDKLKRDPKFDFYVAKGIAWARQDAAGSVKDKNLPAVVVGLGGDYNSDTHEKYINVFTGKNVVFNEDDWENGKTGSLPLFKSMETNEGSAYPKFSFDNATGVMTVEYAPDSEAYNELGKTLVDFSSGVIRFTKIKDLSESKDTAGNSLTVKNPTVYASYVPQAISLTNGDGINDGGFATYDKDYDDVVVMWRKTGVNSSNGLYYKVIRPYRDSDDRLMYVTILENKKVETDTSIVNINENSITGFFDNKTKGNNDGKGYGKLWLFWSGTKGGKNDVYYLSEAIDENNLLVNFGN